MKKFTVIIASLLLGSLSLFGCVETKPREITPLEHCDITIADTPIEKFRIVWAVSPYKALIEKNLTDYYTDEYYFYEFYKLIAEDIAAKIKEVTGHNLEIVSEEKEPTQYEILVGPTNREESAYINSLRIKNFEITVKNGKLTVGGGYNSSRYTGQLKTSFCFVASYHAWDYLIKDILSRGQETVNLEENFNFKGTHEPKIISCVGDSITDGAGSTDWLKDGAVSKDGVLNYPSQLQRILWKDYCVINHGVTGQTARSDLTWSGYGVSYRNTPMYNAALKYAGEYDYLIYMLGTNDSGYDPEWDDDDSENYITSSVNIIESLIPYKNKEIPIIVNCVVVSKNLSTPHGSAKMVELQGTLPKKLKEKGYVNVGFFDMHTYTKENFNKNLLPDGLHPSDKGYTMMAEKLAEYIITLEQPE